MSRYACFDFGQSLGGKLMIVMILQAEGKDKWASAKGTAENDIWGRTIGEDLKAKFESARDATRDSDGLSKIRGSAESHYRDALSDTKRKPDEVKWEYCLVNCMTDTVQAYGVVQGKKKSERSGCFIVAERPISFKPAVSFLDTDLETCK